MKLKILKHTKLYVISLLIGFSFCSSFKSFAQEATLPKIKKKEKQIKFNGSDGPYIVDDRLYRVTSENKLVVFPSFNSDSLEVTAGNKHKDTFYVALQKKYKIPETVYAFPEKMIVISDIEGKYNAFSSFLFSNKIIDENHNWIFGDGHLVLNGDFVDRGKEVTQVLWLIYKLDYQAKKQNGQVHFILGNHEILNFQGDHRYNKGKYIKVAQEISQIENKKEATKYLYSQNSELGQWLATKNVIEKIGEYLFVHAGLSPEILDYKLDLEDINEQVRSSYSDFEDSKNKTTNFLYSTKGPFWYRGLVKSRFEYNKIKSSQLEAILNYYGSKKIIIGHTPVKDILSSFSGRVIMTDVHHGNKKFSGKTKGLLLENNQIFIIDDNAKATPLEN